MKKIFHVLPIFLLAMLTLSCSERRSEQGQGREIELAGDEPDEIPLTNEQNLGVYNPEDTMVNLNGEEMPPRLKDHAQVLVSNYLEIKEALVQDNPEEAKLRANQLNEMLQRNEQENMDLSPKVKNLFTNTTHILRQSSKIILSTNELWEIKSAFSSMAPAAYKLARVSDFTDMRLYYQYCPESFNNRGAYWLSRSEEINNPYAEQDNQSCGETVAVL